jgi:hypothetical protein
MSRRQSSPQDLLAYLRAQGPTLSSELVAHFDISRPTLSRRVQDLGRSVLTIGKGRATQLAARHEDWPSEVPLYQVSESGQVDLFGHLHPIQAGAQTQWFFAPERAQPALMQDEFKEGLFPGWPWFLDDLRPAGFLGRDFGKYMAELYSIDADPEKWNDLELLRTLLSHGFNLQGNFIIGDGRALAKFQRDRVRIHEGLYKDDNPETYSVLAEFALTEGEEFGSSAGGEQPKFTTMACKTPESAPRAVIVKFSPKLDTASGRRWFDLLHAEHIANEILSEADFATAKTQIFHIEDRLFLESERFDRVGPAGRKGLVTLRALDAAYIGQGSGSWADLARKLHADKWITEADRDRMIQLHCFGELIANTDMHWGNLSFFLPERHPFPLAPVYDMLPMRFRPSSTGEIIEREFKPTLPKPEDQAAWLEMYPHALTYWQRITEHPEITSDFKQIARQAITALEQIHTIATT